MTFGKTSGRLFTFIAIFSLVTPFIADFNESHVFNPHWPPHAKFHGAQVLVFTALLNVAALYYTWRQGGIPRDNLITTTLLVSFYWISLGLSILFPGTNWYDPDHVDPLLIFVFGIPGNALSIFVFIPLIAFTSWLGFRHLTSQLP